MDDRGTWVKVVPPGEPLGWFKLQNVSSKLFLYASDDRHVSVGVDPPAPSGNAPKYIWRFMQVAEGHFPISRLPITAGPLSAQNQTISWEVSFVHGPDDGTYSALWAALKMWIDAFNIKLGAKLSLFPAQPPKVGGPGAGRIPPGPHIKFCWGNTPGDEGGYVGTGGVGGIWNDRPESVVVTFSNKQTWAVGSSPGLFQLDLRSAAAHELGHLFGLDHLANPGSVMQPKLNTGQVFPSEIFRRRSRAARRSIRGHNVVGFQRIRQARDHDRGPGLRPARSPR
jgi:hypothetical protein